LSPTCSCFWTPGHSPGSSCLYWQRHGGVLFTGRHLLPDTKGQPRPLQTAKTFHWPRQLRSQKIILDRFSPETLSYLCPGANTGFLRGRGIIDRAYEKISANPLN
ncbi:MAG: MBL fold metallo-hydrolase, partial [Microcystis sp. M53599_WE4]|nr:MBL fold metallo-hydrolase [Microcystis sp. M53599_WE4]